MAYNVKTIALNGIFNYKNLSFTTVTGTDKTISFETDVNETKDPLFFIIDLSKVFIGVKINVLNTDGKVVGSASLDPGAINVFSTTTFGCVDKNGKMTLEFEAIDTTFASDMKLEVVAFSYIPVVNH